LASQQAYEMVTHFIDQYEARIALCTCSIKLKANLNILARGGFCPGFTARCLCYCSWWIHYVLVRLHDKELRDSGEDVKHEYAW